MRAKCTSVIEHGHVSEVELAALDGAKAATLYVPEGEFAPAVGEEIDLEWGKPEPDDDEGDEEDEGASDDETQLTDQTESSTGT
jgi:hypothetical protein